MILSIMCHGALANLLNYIEVLNHAGFEPVTIDQVLDGINGTTSLPENGYLLTLDHAVHSMYYPLKSVFRHYNIKPTLYFHTKPVVERDIHTLDWDEIGELVDDGWVLGNHTHIHTGMDGLTADYIIEDLEYSNGLIKKYTGVIPEHFAYPGGRVCSKSEKIVKQYFKSARLCTTEPFVVFEGEKVEWRELFVDSNRTGIDGIPHEALYISNESDPYRLPGVELAAPLNEPAKFINYVHQGMSGGRQISHKSVAAIFDNNSKAYCDIVHVSASRDCFEYKSLTVEELLQSGIAVVVWGTGGGWDEIKPLVGALLPDKILFFVDSDKSKWGQHLCGVEIAPPNMIAQQDEVVIIIASTYRYQIAKQIEQITIGSV